MAMVKFKRYLGTFRYLQIEETITPDFVCIIFGMLGMNRSGLEYKHELVLKFFCCSFDFIFLSLVYESFHSKILGDPCNLQDGFTN